MVTMMFGSSIWGLRCKIPGNSPEEKNQISFNGLIFEMLAEKGVLDAVDVEFSGRRKSTSKFFGVDCLTLKGIGTTKLYRIQLSEYAKAKVLKKMVNIGYDLSFYIKKAMVKKSEKSKKFYQVLVVSDIGV